MTKRTVLISGAGIGGPTLAYWLLQHGFAPVLVDRAPYLREGGYIIDFWGVGYDVAERMGLLPELNARGYLNDRAIFVRANGTERSGFGGRVLREALQNRFLSIQRSDLSKLVFERVSDKVETVFGDEIERLDERDNGVDVQFASGRRRTFDLVIGADGLHSKVRALTFGSHDLFERYLGYCAAAFVSPGYSQRDEHVYLSYAAPGRQVSRFALRDGQTGFLFVFRQEQRDLDGRDIAAQKRALLDIYSSDNWHELPEIKLYLTNCTELYFDAVAQVEVPEWSMGRIALVGDAAYCPSLLAGEGAALAMAGAYILAGELAQCGEDYAVAFRLYERRFRPFMERKQKSARNFASSFTPKTELGLSIRDVVLNLTAIPIVAKWVLGRFVTDRFELPSYP